MLILYVLLIVLLLRQRGSFAQDAWFGVDKVKHFGVSLVCGLLGGVLASNDQWAFALGLAPGVWKEEKDARTAGNAFSYKDLVWDALGVGAGVLLQRWLAAHLI